MSGRLCLGSGKRVRQHRKQIHKEVSGRCLGGVWTTKVRQYRKHINKEVCGRCLDTFFRKKGQTALKTYNKEVFWRCLGGVVRQHRKQINKEVSGRCLGGVWTTYDLILPCFFSYSCGFFRCGRFFFSLDFMLDLIPLLAISWRVSSELLCFVFYWLEHQFPALAAENLHI